MKSSDKMNKGNFQQIANHTANGNCSLKKNYSLLFRPSVLKTH